MGNGDLKNGLETVLKHYLEARAEEEFGTSHPLWSVFKGLERSLLSSQAVKVHHHLRVRWSAGAGKWAKSPWIAIYNQQETRSMRKGLYMAFGFCEDMSGVYLVLTQGIAELKKQMGTEKARRELRTTVRKVRKFCQKLPDKGFKLDSRIDMKAQKTAEQEDSKAATIAYKFYRAGKIPDDEAIFEDMEALLAVYTQYLNPNKNQTATHVSQITFDFPSALGELIEQIGKRGFVFEPWQIAAYVTALRTKPFVLLAGVSGTGKSRLPELVAEITGGTSALVAVRPDWTDSAEVLGYMDLKGVFRPGQVLRELRQAAEHPNSYHMCVLDEMNLARVEYYLAEILSAMESRFPGRDGGYESRPLLARSFPHMDKSWIGLGIPANFAITGTVNMDETTHGFSRKVLDRAFTLELSDIDLHQWPLLKHEKRTTPWPVSAWYPQCIRLGELVLENNVRQTVEEVMRVLTHINSSLRKAQLQVGYRIRDEISLFVIQAKGLEEYFVSRQGEKVDPLDLALQMKILPRLAGGTHAIRQVLIELLALANGLLEADEVTISTQLQAWEKFGRPARLPDARFPGLAARLCLMWERLLHEGYTAFWL